MFTGNAVFDPHALAEEKKTMQQSQNLKSLEDARQKILDIFVRQISPRHHILGYTEQFTNGEDIKKDSSFFKVKDFLEKNSQKCHICGQSIKFAQVVEPILSHDLHSRMVKKESRTHVNHAECANGARQLLLGDGHKLPQILEEGTEEGVLKNVARLSVAKYAFIPMSDGNCYCKNKFSSKIEIMNQNILMNIIEQHYLI